MLFLNIEIVITKRSCYITESVTDLTITFGIVRTRYKGNALSVYPDLPIYSGTALFTLNKL